MSTPSPGLTELPLAGTAARGRNGWFDARLALIFATDELISGSASGYQPPRSPGGNRVADPGVTIAIRSKHLGRIEPIWFQLTQADAIALATAILRHADTSPTVLVTVSDGVPTVRAHGPVRTVIIDPSALPPGNQHIELLREKAHTLPEPLRSAAVLALADLHDRSALTP